MKQRLQVIEKRIIVGGENLLEKAEEQERLLEESAKELEERKRKAEQLHKALEEKEVHLVLSNFILFVLARSLGIFVICYIHICNLHKCRNTKL